LNSGIDSGISAFFFSSSVASSQSRMLRHSSGTSNYQKFSTSKYTNFPCHWVHKEHSFNSIPKLCDSQHFSIQLDFWSAGIVSRAHVKRKNLPESESFPDCFIFKRNVIESQDKEGWLPIKLLKNFFGFLR